MSNECTITFWVQEARKQEADEILTTLAYEPSDDGIGDGVSAGLYYFAFYDAKVPHFAKAVKALVAKGIAFDFDSGRSDDDQPVRRCIRYNEEGVLIVMKWSEDEEAIPVSDLMNIRDDHEALKQIIDMYHHDITPLPWTHQEEYGKRYLAAQLLLQGVEQLPLV